jgi:hypothetical protein
MQWQISSYKENMCTCASQFISQSQTPDKMAGANDKVGVCPANDSQVGHDGQWANKLAANRSALSQSAGVSISTTRQFGISKPMPLLWIRLFVSHAFLVPQ